MCKANIDEDSGLNLNRLNIPGKVLCCFYFYNQHKHQPIPFNEMNKIEFTTFFFLSLFSIIQLYVINYNKLFCNYLFYFILFLIILIF